MVGKIFCIILLIFLGIIIIGTIVSDFYDSKRTKERFNNGVCPNCNTWLEHIPCENSNRIYECINCGHTVRIPDTSTIDMRYCNISDRMVWTVNCHYCKSKKYCKYYKTNTTN